MDLIYPNEAPTFLNLKRNFPNVVNIDSQLDKYLLDTYSAKCLVSLV